MRSSFYPGSHVLGNATLETPGWKTWRRSENRKTGAGPSESSGDPSRSLPESKRFASTQFSRPDSRELTEKSQSVDSSVELTRLNCLQQISHACARYCSFM